MPAAETRWFEAPAEAVLFSLQKFPVNNADFIGVEKPDATEEEGAMPWGQNEYIGDLIESQQLVEVAINGDTPGLITLIPRTVQIIIPYFQVSVR